MENIKLVDQIEWAAISGLTEDTRLREFECVWFFAGRPGLYTMAGRDASWGQQTPSWEAIDRGNEVLAQRKHGLFEQPDGSIVMRILMGCASTSYPNWGYFRLTPDQFKEWSAVEYGGRTLDEIRALAEHVNSGSRMIV